MISSYEVGYSTDAYNDLREIYAYIANELLVPDTAATQLRRIQKKIFSLCVGRMGTLAFQESTSASGR